MFLLIIIMDMLVLNPNLEVKFFRKLQVNGTPMNSLFIRDLNTQLLAKDTILNSKSSILLIFTNKIMLVVVLLAIGDFQVQQHLHQLVPLKMNLNTQLYLYFLALTIMTNKESQKRKKKNSWVFLTILIFRMMIQSFQESVLGSWWSLLIWAKDGYTKVAWLFLLVRGLFSGT
jgi:hypothetical protein